MKLKDFLTLKVGSGIILSGNVYNPLINYDWSTTTTSGLRYLRDVGSTPTYNASMYFGRGAYLNGVDQAITVPINTTIQTSLKRVNGVITINETSQILTNYVISGVGVHKDYYLFTRLLTTAEKDSYTNTPELFYVMAQADITCVLNMPMCETDRYVRNMKSYSEVEKMTDPSFVSSNADVSGVYLCTVAITNNALEISPTSDGGDAYIRFEKAVDIGSYVQIDIDIVNADNSTSIYIGSTSGYYKIDLGVHSNKANGKHSFIVLATTTRINVQINETNKRIANKIIVNSLSIKQLTGIRQITNYTTSVRDNAKNLQYGLQTCKFVRDSLGVIQSASDYLECDGVGYVNTGWIPDATNEDFTIEIVRYCPSNPQSDGDGNNKDDSSRLLLLQTNNILYPEVGIRISGHPQKIAGITTNVFNHIIMSYNSTTKQVICYLNGIARISYVTNLTTATNSLYIGMSKYSMISTSKRRLFKVHNKVLTQEEITENYNSYVAKGLLS